jgi:light-regulated signal transduction histidine kinase (bacteriophytochrome)
MIVEDEGAVLSNRSRAVRHVLAATGRMGTLIDRLLELSRVTRAEMNRGRVDLSVLASGIAADLQHAEPARRVEFTIARDLVADADPLLVRVVLENLLRNAWKYSSRRPLTQIAVESVADTHPPVYVVRDNGAGFDMSEAERLFVAFQRLHDADEFDGAGIGLATTMRVIQRHGGRIWAEARSTGAPSSSPSTRVARWRRASRPPRRRSRRLFRRALRARAGETPASTGCPTVTR